MIPARKRRFVAVATGMVMVLVGTYLSSTMNLSRYMLEYRGNYVEATTASLSLPLLASYDVGQSGFNETFSACLLIMDDNRRLPEWLAYHYYVLPLRYLVIAVDPNSQTSPSEILSRWQHRMTIVQWTDHHFVPDPAFLKAEYNTTMRRARNAHRFRQKSFYQACTQHLHKHSRTLTYYGDTDELVTLTPEYWNRTVSNGTLQREELLKQPGHVWAAFHLLYRANHTGLLPPQQPSPACIAVPRVSYKPIESALDVIHRHVPAGIDATRLYSLRHKFRGSEGHHGLAKSIIDVQHYRPNMTDGHVHRPVWALCRQNTYMLYADAPIGIHHYMGDQQLFLSRHNDARSGLRTLDRWLEGARTNRGPDDDHMTHWIGGFVQQVGLAEAITLLAGNGFARNDSVIPAELLPRD